MSSPAARRRKNARTLMISDYTPKKVSGFDFGWKIECIKCKCEIYSLKKIRVDKTLYGHTTIFVDGYYKYVAPHDYIDLGVYDDVDVCWTCFDCFKKNN